MDLPHPLMGMQPPLLDNSMAMQGYSMPPQGPFQAPVKEGQWWLPQAAAMQPYEQTNLSMHIRGQISLPMRTPHRHQARHEPYARPLPPIPPSFPVDPAFFSLVPPFYPPDPRALPPTPPLSRPPTPPPRPSLPPHIVQLLHDIPHGPMHVPAPQRAIEYAGYPGAQLLHGAAASGDHSGYPAAQWHNSPSAPQQDMAPPGPAPLVVSQPGPTRRKHDGRRAFKVPLPPGTDEIFCETVATKELLGLRCHDCVNNLRAVSDKCSHSHIAENVLGQERVMDEYFPGDRVSVHRTWFPGSGTSRVGCVFNMTSAKLTGNKEFCLGHILTMMVRKLYHWWTSKKGGMTQYRPLEYFVGKAEAGDMADVGVHWGHIYIVAVRRWKRERGSGEPHFCYFPEIEILI